MSDRLDEKNEASVGALRKHVIKIRLRESMTGIGIQLQMQHFVSDHVADLSALGPSHAENFLYESGGHRSVHIQRAEESRSQLILCIEFYKAVGEFVFDLVGRLEIENCCIAVV